MLDISQEVSDVASATTTGIQSPTIQERKINSSVACTTRRSRSAASSATAAPQTHTGIPYLQGDVPVLGNLFRDTGDNKTCTELMVLITPHVIDDTRKARKVTDELARLPAVQPSSSARRPGERGWALVSVLWALTMIALMAAAAQALTVTAWQSERHAMVDARASADLDAAVVRAVLGIADTRPDQHWRTDGAARVFVYDGLRIRVSVQDELGRVDLNAASTSLIRALLVGNGVASDDASTLADRIADWRSTSGLTSLKGATDADYRAAGLSYGPRHGPFHRRRGAARARHDASAVRAISRRSPSTASGPPSIRRSRRARRWPPSIRRIPARSTRSCARARATTASARQPRRRRPAYRSAAPST